MKPVSRPVRVEHDAGHARDVERRVVDPHEGVAVRGHEPARARAVEEVPGARPRLPQPLPALAGRLLLGTVGEEAGIPVESVRRVGGTARVAEPRQRPDASAPPAPRAAWRAAPCRRAWCGRRSTRRARAPPALPRARPRPRERSGPRHGPRPRPSRAKASRPPRPARRAGRPPAAARATARTEAGRASGSSERHCCTNALDGLRCAAAARGAEAFDSRCCENRSASVRAS